jgi:diguanylate cyclase (GGDEF)-like protein/PAS domain S-box-containing protein
MPDNKRSIRWMEAAIVGLAHFGVASGSLALARWSTGLASVWLPNAILLAYLLLTSRDRWPAACAAVLASGIFANWLGGASFPLALVFGATNIFEPLVVVAVLRPDVRPVDLERMSDLMRFVFGAVIACALSASAAAGAMVLAGEAGFADAWTGWFVSAGLGLLIATPILLIGYRQWRFERISRDEMMQGAAALALVLAASLVVFGQSRLPLSFILQPLVMFATFRLRALGAASATLLIAIVGTVMMSRGFGPAAFVQMPLALRMALFQGFLGLTILTALPIAALLTQRDRFSLKLSEREAQYRSVVDSVSDVIFQTDREGRWTYLNPAWEAQTGYPVAETIGTSFLKHVVEEDREAFLERLKGLDTGLFTQVRHQFRFRTASGEERWGEVQAKRLTGPDGQIAGAAGIVVDISDRLALAAMVEEARRKAERDAKAAMLLAATDELTGVSSRRAFLAMLDQLLELNKPVSIALFDIDHFKSVNDRFGHAVGDEVLRRVAQVAAGCVRDGDLVGRLGGEEFAVLMPGATMEQAAAVGERLRKSCAGLQHPPGVTVTVSLGVATAGAATTSATLLRDADAALYRAKYEGRNCLRRAA